MGLYVHLVYARASWHHRNTHIKCVALMNIPVVYVYNLEMGLNVLIQIMVKKATCCGICTVLIRGCCDVATSQVLSPYVPSVLWHSKRA